MKIFFLQIEEAILQVEGIGYYRMLTRILLPQDYCYHHHHHQVGTKTCDEFIVKLLLVVRIPVFSRIISHPTIRTRTKITKFTFYGKNAFQPGERSVKAQK